MQLHLQPRLADIYIEERRQAASRWHACAVIRASSDTSAAAPPARCGYSSSDARRHLAAAEEAIR